MRRLKQLLMLSFSLLISNLSFAKTEDYKTCQNLKIEEDTGATIYNSGVTCGGMGK